MVISFFCFISMEWNGILLFCSLFPWNGIEFCCSVLFPWNGRRLKTGFTEAMRGELMPLWQRTSVHSRFYLLENILPQAFIFYPTYIDFVLLSRSTHPPNHERSLSTYLGKGLEGRALMELGSRFF